MRVNALLAGFRHLMSRRRDAELDDELRAFYEASVEAKLEAGMPRAEAERAARIELGSPAAVKDWVGDVRWTTQLESVWQDVRYAARLLRRQPGFSIAAVLTLALGIGATTAIFTLVDRVMLRPLPLSDPDRVVSLHAHQGESVSRTFTYPPFLRLREHASAAFDLVSASGSRSPRVRLGDDTRLTPAAFVTEDYFDVLGVRPSHGRFFAADEHRPGAPPVVVVTEAFWRTRMAADPNAIGRTIRVGDLDAPVVGIAPRGVRGLDIASPVEIFLPLMTAEAVLPPANYFHDTVITVAGGGYSPQAWLTVTARLRPGVSVEQAEALLATMTITPPRAGTTAATMRLVPTVEEALRARTRTDTRRFAALLATVVSLVLLIGCANLAGLILARNEQRRRETAVRLALGARAGRVVRMFIVEATMLSLAGGVTGLLAATWMLQAMGAFVIPGAIRVETLELGMTWRVFLFAAGAAMFTTLATGLLPAVAGSRMDVSSAMKARVGAPTSERNLARGALVAAQVGLSLVLIVGALLFVRSLHAALATDVGADSRLVAYATMSFRGSGYDDARRGHLLRELSERLTTLPAIERVTFGPPPLAGTPDSTQTFRIDGMERRLSDTLEFGAGPDYFETLGIPMVRGRALDPQDHEERAPAVVVINEAFARRAWPGLDPVGRRLVIPPEGPDMEVVGVARDGKYRTLTEAGQLAIYYPWRLARAGASETIATRSARGAAASVPAILREIRRLDADLTITASGTLEERIARLAMTQRLGASLLSWFGVLAFALAVAGTYGLIAYAVARRTGEIGVRIALGAQPGDVARMMMRRSLVPVAVGIVLGIAGAFGLTKLAAGFLFGIEPHDPISFAGAALALTLGAALASYIPARRAAHVDPVVALRTE